MVILADDLGYGDVSFNGTLSDYSTPNIDSIAANGVKCTNGYVTHPVCGPSRAALITGPYQQRVGYENNSDTDDTNPRLGLPMNEKLLSDILKPAGYVCGAIGKWHLGFDANFHALNRGFDVSRTIFRAPLQPPTQQRKRAEGPALPPVGAAT